MIKRKWVNLEELREQHRAAIKAVEAGEPEEA